MKSLRTLVAVVLAGMVSTGCTVESGELDAIDIDSIGYDTLEGVPGGNGQFPEDGAALRPYLDEIALSKLTNYDTVNGWYVPVNTVTMMAIRANPQRRKALKYMLKAAGSPAQTFHLCDNANQNCVTFNGEVGLGLPNGSGYANWVSGSPLNSTTLAGLEQQQKLLATWGVYFNLVELPIYIMTEGAGEVLGTKIRDCTFWSNSRFSDRDPEIHACSDIVMDEDEAQDRFCGHFSDVDCPITYEGPCTAGDVDPNCGLSYPWASCLGNHNVIISMTY